MERLWHHLDGFAAALFLCSQAISKITAVCLFDGAFITAFRSKDCDHEGSAMTQTQWKRLGWTGLIVGAVAFAISLILFALRQNINLYYTPSQLQAGEGSVGKVIRVGGLVVQKSLHKEADSLKVQFRITDLAKEVPVVYQGILPDLFREGQGVIVTGQWTSKGLVEASAVLAKHDENYMPREIASSLRK